MVKDPTVKNIRVLAEELWLLPVFFLIGFIIIGRNCVKWILCDIIVIAAAILTIMIMLIIH